MSSTSSDGVRPQDAQEDALEDVAAPSPPQGVFGPAHLAPRIVSINGTMITLDYNDPEDSADE